MKALLVAILVISLAASAYFGYQSHRRSQVLSAIAPHAKNASLRLQNAIKLDTGESKVTFKELFERLEGDIAEIDKRILEVQTVSTPSTSALTEPVVEYLRSSQELLRAMLQGYRLLLEHRSVRDRAQEAIAEYGASSGYTAELASRRAKAALDEMKKVGDRLAQAKPELNSILDRLSKSRNALEPILGADPLLSAEQLTSLISKSTAASAGASAASSGGGR